ncbi:MAG: hypothetical protein FJ100_16595 [Deltaproteobacteria bacterium]|nr:hypothetical protein [Deltaproteobacteria bacterium]
MNTGPPVPRPGGCGRAASTACPCYGPIASASRTAWQALSAGGGPGYFRNDDGGWYDSQEWLFIDLRVLRWLDRAVA